MSSKGGWQASGSHRCRCARRQTGGLPSIRAYSSAQQGPPAAIVRDALYQYKLPLLLVIAGGQVRGTALQDGQEMQKYLDVSFHRGVNVRKDSE
ncbi:hypothetical protein EVA_10078 [gut metagenome]|uniref:Uncharacterized protein n=1 Tax=gut metagenome TaxID=749906 RepID=J9CNW8_9ZZZZ